MYKYQTLMEKPRIAKLFISRMIPPKKTPMGPVDIAMVFDDGRYVEYEFKENAQSLTYWLAKRVKEVFGDYRLDGSTDVCVTETIGKKDPLYVYLDCLGQQIGFDVQTTNLDMVVRRVAKGVTHPILRKGNKYIRKSSQINSRHMQAVWRYIVRKDRCSWITPQYDAQLVMKSYVMKRRKQALRLGMYYLHLKEYMRKYEENRNK